MKDIVTDNAREWWMSAKSKGADYLRIIKPSRYYAIEACKYGVKARIAQKSLGTSDEKVARSVYSDLLTTLDSVDPEVNIEKYILHKLRMAECCQGKKDYERLYQSRIKTEKTNASRLKAHLLPFCKHYRIHDIRELYRRDNVGKYLEYLQETVAGLDTAKAIVKTTKAFLNWYDAKQDTPLVNRDFINAYSHYGKKLGYKQPKLKPSLTRDQCKDILASKIVDIELRAIIIAHLVGGLRDTEIQGLRWKDLDADGGYIKVMAAKGGIPRYAQFPRIMQEAFSAIQHNRTERLFPNDYVFSQSSYDSRNRKIKSFLRAAVGAVGKDYGSNCLRRSGSDCIDDQIPGLGGRQLGHAINDRTTETYYHNKRNFNAVNQFWNDLWAEVKSEGMHMVYLSDDQSNVVNLSA